MSEDLLNKSAHKLLNLIKSPNSKSQVFKRLADQPITLSRQHNLQNQSPPPIRKLDKNEEAKNKNSKSENKKLQNISDKFQCDKSKL